MVSGLDPESNGAASGCAYIIDDAPAGAAGPNYCGEPLRPGSPYCPAHHARCHLRPGSRAQVARISDIEALAEVVGGRQARPHGEPAQTWLRDIEEKARPVSRRNRSRYVQKKPKPAARKLSPTEPGPTPERLTQGLVERVPQPIADTAGQTSRPYRAVDTLAVMERRGSITAEMRQAGEDFRARFAVAQLDPLRAVDLRHLRMGERGLRPEAAGPGLRIEAARGAVWRAIQAVGGLGSPAGSCLWHVLGWERPLKEWALERGWSGRRVSQESASGILVAALGALESLIFDWGVAK